MVNWPSARRGNSLRQCGAVLSAARVDIEARLSQCLFLMHSSALFSGRERRTDAGGYFEGSATALGEGRCSVVVVQCIINVSTCILSTNYEAHLIYDSQISCVKSSPRLRRVLPHWCPTSRHFIWSPQSCLRVRIITSAIGHANQPHPFHLRQPSLLLNYVLQIAIRLSSSLSNNSGPSR